MSRVALDFPPEAVLAGAALLPLASIGFVHALRALAYLFPLEHNVFRRPSNGLHEHVASGQRSWRHWLLALLAGVQAAVWAAYSIKTGVIGGSHLWRLAVECALVSIGWVSGLSSSDWWQMEWDDGQTEPKR